MKKTLFYYVLIAPLIIFPGFAGSLPLSYSDTLETSTLIFIRQGFYESIESHSQTKRTMEFIESNFSEKFLHDEPVLLAYYGVLNALKAKHVFNPFSKISYLRTALRNLDEAVKYGPYNLEVRFLRFSVLHNIPSFLGFSEKLQKDTNAVFTLLTVEKKYSDLDSETAINVIKFVIESKRLGAEQQNELETLAQQLKEYEQLSSD